MCTCTSHNHTVVYEHLSNSQSLVNWEHPEAKIERWSTHKVSNSVNNVVNILVNDKHTNILAIEHIQYSDIPLHHAHLLQPKAHLYQHPLKNFAQVH